MKKNGKRDSQMKSYGTKIKGRINYKGRRAITAREKRLLRAMYCIPKESDG
jgi:hypothetical protein